MRRTLAAYAAALVLAAALFLLFPGIDLWAAQLFYRADGGFYLGNAWPVRAIYAGVPYLTDAVVVGVAALYLLSLRCGRPVAGVDGRVAAYLLLALALGPGLVVNTMLKDHWGRARPSQIEAFGGTRQFTPAPLPADSMRQQLLLPRRPSRHRLLPRLLRPPHPRAPATAGGDRRGGGGGRAHRPRAHGARRAFPLRRRLLRRHRHRHRPFAPSRHRRQRRARPLGRASPTVAPGGAPGAGSAHLLLLSMAFVDRPLARYFHESDPGFP